jgi:rhamnosyltransferase
LVKILVKFVVLLATFNGGRYIRTQIDSLISQTVNVDIFVSDDQSTDDTMSILQEYERNLSNFKIIDHDQKFGCAAKNFYYLINNVVLETYDYVAFCDQDDIWAHEKLSFSVHQMQIYSADGYSSDCIAFWEGKNNKKKLIKKSYGQTKFDHWFESPGPGCTQVFTAKTFKKFQKFIRKHWSLVQEIDYHDWLVYAFYRHNNLIWVISDKPLLFYRQHLSNQMGANSGVTQIFKRLKLIQKRWYRLQINTIYLLCSGSEANFFNVTFMLRNFLQLRRNKFYSILIFFLFMIRVL